MLCTGREIGEGISVNGSLCRDEAFAGVVTDPPIMEK